MPGGGSVAFYERQFPLIGFLMLKIRPIRPVQKESLTNDWKADKVRGRIRLGLGMHY